MQPFLPGSGSTADMPLFSHLGVDEGMTMGQILSIAQDRHGLMWFATQEGLVRYDGLNLKHYFARSNDPTTLDCDWIWSLAIDAQGVLWAATRSGGLSRYDGSRDCFTTYRHNPADTSSLASDTVYALHVDRRQRLWLATEAGLQSYDPQRDCFESYSLGSKEGDGSGETKGWIRALAESPQGGLWLAVQEQGLAYFSPVTGRCTWLNVPEYAEALCQVRSLQVTPDNTLWIGTFHDGLLCRTAPDARVFVPEHPVIQQMHNQRACVYRILQYLPDELWVGADIGLVRLKDNGASAALLQHEPSNPQSLPGPQVDALYKDQQGGLWLGSVGGIGYWSPAVQQFTPCLVAAEEEDKQRGQVMTLGFAKEPDGSLWVATYYGLYKLDPTGRRREFFQTDRQTTPHGLLDQRITAVHLDRQNQLWIGTREHGVALYDREKQRFRHFLHAPGIADSLPGNAITSISDAHNGQLWITTYGQGVALFDPASGRCQVYDHQAGEGQSLSDGRALTLVEEQNASGRVVWIGTVEGLNRLDRSTGEVLQFKVSPGQSHCLANNFINGLTQDRQGNLWIATHGGGVCQLPVNSLRSYQWRFRQFSRAEGLPSSVIYGVIEDPQGRLWMSSNKGLLVLSPDSEKFTQYTHRNGLQSLEFISHAYYQADDNQIFFGGVKGFNCFYPDQIKPQATCVAPQVISITTSTHSWKTPASVSELSVVELEPDDRMLQVEVGVRQFGLGQKIRFRYQLQGFDTEWNALQHGRTITYTNLPAGDWLLVIEAASEFGDWSQSNVSLPIVAHRTKWHQLRRLKRPQWLTAGLGALIRTTIGQPAYWHHKRSEARKDNYRRTLEKEVTRRTHSLEQKNRDLASMNGELRALNGKLERLNQRLAESSVTDPLTSLPNRHYLDQMLERLSQEPAPRPDPLSPIRFFMLIDIEQLKVINQIHGNPVGDQVISELALLLQLDNNNSSQAQSTLVRWSGDGFIITGEVTRPEAAEVLADSILQRVARHQLGGLSINVNIGISFYPMCSKQPQSLSLQQVLRLCCIAKQQAAPLPGSHWVSLSAGQVPPPGDGLMPLLELKLAEAVKRKQITLRRSEVPEPEIVQAEAA